jgi:hypothetical protein
VVDFGVSANMDLGVKLGAVGLPSLMADLVLKWDWRLGDTKASVPDISINNIRID